MRLRIAAIALLLVVSGCATRQPVTATGRIAGQEVNAAVDGDLARHYLEDYGDGSDMDRVIDLAIAKTRPDPFDAVSLEALTAATSTDFATLYFVRALYDDPVNRAMQDRFEILFRGHVEEGAAGSTPPRDASWVIAFVPGYGYARKPSTGADFALQRALLQARGYNVHLIETGEIGYVEPNAAIIARELEALGAAYENIIVVSTSKGGPETALALGTPANHAALRNVRAWISVGGIFRGSPYADHLHHHPFRCVIAAIAALRDNPRGMIRNLSTEVRAPIMDGLSLPADLLVVHYVGAPLESQVEPANRRRYQALKHLGPNDGLTLLADEIVQGNVVITALGLDHYYRHPQIDLITLALTELVLEKLGDEMRE